MSILENLNKNNLHHAYLIEGVSEKIIPEINIFIEELGIKTSNNPDFYNIKIDSFKIEHAHNLRLIQSEKSFSGQKKIFLISVNNFLLEAQNILLKIFEEPKKDTHFFLILPNKNILLKTLLSRFYLISENNEIEKESIEEIEKFILMKEQDRISFIKNLLTEKEKIENEDKEISENSTRIRVLNFLNALEFTLHQKKSHLVQNSSNNFFEHIFKVREFINQPGSSIKSLMESLAFKIPNF